MEAVLQTAVLSNATTAELHYLLACTSLSFATLTPNTQINFSIVKDLLINYTSCSKF